MTSRVDTRKRWMALIVLCLSAAAALIPVTSGGAIANVGATAAVLLALGVHRQVAINFGLASGLPITTSAAVAAIVGLATSLAVSRRSVAPAGGASEPSAGGSSTKTLVVSASG